MKIKYFFLAIATFLTTFIISSSPAHAAISDWQRSANIEPQSTTDFASANFNQSLTNLKSTGANHVTLIIPVRQTSLTSADIYNAWNTPTDESLKAAIQKAHSLGLHVTLKPHLEVESGEWRAMINPSDRDTWYNNYGKLLNKYATIAQQTGVEQIIVGAELYRVAAQTQNYDNTQRWKTMISQVKAVYTGQLTYSANHTSPAEFKEIGFWSDLNYLGISGYFPLDPNNNNPSVDSLKNAWNSIYYDQIKPTADATGKPILFTEIGYRSVSGAHTEPFAWWRTGAVDQDEQARDYEALFAYWNGISNFRGLHLWDWSSNPNAGGPNDSGYTPQNKKAEQVMKQYFGAAASSSPAASTTPTITSSPSPTSNPNATFETAATVSPASPHINTTASITVNVKASDTINNILLDIEIYNAQDQKIAQQVYDNQNFSTNAKAFTYNWTPKSLGNYTVKIGIFGANWNGLKHWNNNAKSFTVVMQSTASATPTPSPTIKPTATPPTIPAPPTTAQPTQSGSPTPQSNIQVEIWWPADGVTINGVQPFKARLPDRPIEQYKMYWQVDGGGLNEMFNAYQDAPHKESWVDVNSWNWRANGPYKINFVAKDNANNTLGQKEITISIAR